MTGNYRRKIKCPGCPKKIDAALPMCFDCWMSKIPYSARHEIYHAYSDHQSRLSEGSKATKLRALLDQAIALVKESSDLSATG